MLSRLVEVEVTQIEADDFAAPERQIEEQPEGSASRIAFGSVWPASTANSCCIPCCPGPRVSRYAWLFTEGTSSLQPIMPI